MINKYVYAFWVFLCCGMSVSFGQTPKTLWSTPDELKQWTTPLDPDNPPSIQVMTDSTATFVRISPPLIAQIAIPGLAALNESDLTGLPVLVAAGSQNAIKITARHTTALQTLDGLWVHRNTVLSEDTFQAAPFFTPQSFPGDGAWHDLVFTFSDSPLFDSHSDVVGVAFGFFAPHFRDDGTVNRLSDQTLPTAYLDIARIEFISIPETLPQPAISGFQPAKGVLNDPVTIQGSGFAQPPSRNLVSFGNTPSQVISGTSSTLVANAVDDGPISVRVPGGATSVSVTSFVLLGPPRRLLSINGDGQVKPVNTVLQPFVVTLADFQNSGIPGRTIAFSVVSGTGTLSQSSAVTDDSGTASVVLTLPTNPGSVTVQASFPDLAPVMFHAIATSP